MEFACSPCARLGFIRALQLPPTVQKQARLTADLKLPTSVIVSVYVAQVSLAKRDPRSHWN